MVQNVNNSKNLEPSVNLVTLLNGVTSDGVLQLSRCSAGEQVLLSDELPHSVGGSMSKWVARVTRTV